MISLEKEITSSKFNKFSRNVYGISSNGANPVLFLTKESAYNKMENIKRQLEAIECLENETLDDLDCRPTTLKTEGGSTHELLTISIQY